MLNGDILACDHVKAACRRYLSFFDKYEFSAEACEKVIRFVGKLRHVTGKHAGQPFVLEEWQKFLIYSIYGFRREDGTRLVHNAYIEVARKSGKTALVAALTLYHLIADGEANAQVILSATSARQAALCFSMAKDFIKPLDTEQTLLKYRRDTIKFPLTKSQLEVVAADASRLDGKNASMFVCDEVHEFRDGSVYNVLQSSTGMRSQPLGVCITTAGFKLSGWAYDYRATMLDLIHGNKEDDSTFAVVYTLDYEDEATDPSKWIKSNPNLGVTVSESYLKEQLQQAQNNPSLWVNYLTKLQNMWVSSRETWIDEKYIRAASSQWDMEEHKGEVVYLGLDLSAVSDMTSVTLLLPVDEGESFLSRTWYFLPQEQLTVSENRERYKQAARKGELIITQGNVVDIDYIVSHIMQLADQYTIAAVGYDTWNSTATAVRLEEEGVNMLPYSMSIASVNRPTRELERLILSGKITMWYNSLDRWCFSNVTLKSDWNGNSRPVKTSASQKIDGVMSLVIALGAWLNTTHMGDPAFVLPSA